MRHNPRKRFGQNFLIGEGIIAEIIAAIHPQQMDQIVEIGPGLGALTLPLLQHVRHLDVVEIDRDIVKKLRAEYSPDNLTIHAIDALKFDFSSLGNRLRIVGNLPYNISTPLLFHLSLFAAHIHDMHCMLQKEVVDRMVAVPATSQYGRLSVMLQYRFDMEYVLSVPAESFHPIPKVESAIVHLVPRSSALMNADDIGLLSQVVAAAFSQRRKTIRNTLQRYLTADDFDTLGLNPGLRAENLAVNDFVAISNFLHQRIGNLY